VDSTLSTTVHPVLEMTTDYSQGVALAGVP